MGKRGYLAAGVQLQPADAGGRLPGPPAHLSAEADRFWRKTAKLLRPSGRLCTADLAAFERLLRLLELTANPRRYFAAGRVVGCDGSGDFKTASSGDHAAGGNEGVSELVSGLWPHTRRKIADTRRGFHLGGWRNC
jgi:hypothetical protein